jgi:hypothetical protein
MSQIFYEVLLEKRASADTATLLKELEAGAAKAKEVYARRDSINRGNFLYPAVGVAGLAIPAAIYSRRKAGERAKGESEEDYNARRSAQTGKYVRPAAIAGGLIGGGINMYRGSKFNAEVPQINEALRALQARVPYLPPDDVSNAVERLNATIRKNR